MKASIEYENDEFQRLGSVVTKNGDAGGIDRMDVEALLPYLQAHRNELESDEVRNRLQTCHQVYPHPQRLVAHSEELDGIHRH